MKKYQRGITFFGMLFVGTFVAIAGIVGAQVFPTYTEFLTVQKAVNKAAKEGGTVAEVRAAFDRTAAVDYISSISGKDLSVTKSGDQIVVSFAYEREIHLGGPAYLVMKYTGASK